MGLQCGIQQGFGLQRFGGRRAVHMLLSGFMVEDFANFGLKVSFGFGFPGRGRGSFKGCLTEQSIDSRKIAKKVSCPVSRYVLRCSTNCTPNSRHHADS